MPARRNSGPKVVPINIKKLKGTYRKDRERPAPNVCEKKPIPPSNLTKRAKQIFRHMVKRLDELGLASRSFTEMLALLCSEMAEVEKLDSIIAETGSTYKTNNSQGEQVVKQRPEVKIREQSIKHVHSLLVEFGLSPSSIQRVGATQKPKPNEPGSIEAFRNRQKNGWKQEPNPFAQI